ncbi:MAG: FxsA family protein [Candidatus Pelagibacter sp. TMED165]|nr:MAG: FxsA family protein [Candidatus Pelagibacter sp. TMED165]
MNSFFLIFLAIPALEIFLMIKIGGKIGALSTISLVFFTAVIGVYFAKIEGIKTIRSGFLNLYQNKTPIYEIISGASIAIAAILLIIPGFFTDTVGFLLLIPISRKFLINILVRKNIKVNNKESKTLDGEIVEDKKDEL